MFDEPTRVMILNSPESVLFRKHADIMQCYHGMRSSIIGTKTFEGVVASMGPGYFTVKNGNGEKFPLTEAKARTLLAEASARQATIKLIHVRIFW